MNLPKLIRDILSWYIWKNIVNKVNIEYYKEWKWSCQYNQLYNKNGVVVNYRDLFEEEDICSFDPYVVRIKDNQRMCWIPKRYYIYWEQCERQLEGLHEVVIFYIGNKGYRKTSEDSLTLHLGYWNEMDDEMSSSESESSSSEILYSDDSY
jgi:hypothetical protein